MTEGGGGTDDGGGREVGQGNRWTMEGESGEFAWNRACFVETVKQSVSWRRGREVDGERRQDKT